MVENGTFVWENQGQVVLLKDVAIEGGYWEQKIVLGTMKGSKFNSIVPKHVTKYAKDNDR